MSKDTLDFLGPVPWDEDDDPGLAPALGRGELDAALRARVAQLEAALEKAQFALLYGDKEEFSEALDAIDAALEDAPQ